MSGKKRAEILLYEALGYGKVKGRPRRDPKVALEVLALAEDGLSDAQIADRFGWAKQVDDYSNKKRHSSTVYRYRNEAYQILRRLGCNHSG